MDALNSLSKGGSSVITVHKFLPAWGLPDLSPFCIKVETYLRMTGQPYQTKLGTMKQAPKGKIPYIAHEGRLLGDSTAIVDYFEARTKMPLDQGLSPRELGTARAFQSMLEEHFYFLQIWRRWVDTAGWAVVQPEIARFLAASGVPRFMTGVVSNLIRRQVIKGSYSQGTGRHTPQEIDAIGIKLLAAVADWLGDQPCMLGAAPRTLDATVYAFLTTLLGAPLEGAILDYARSRTNLVAYQARMQGRYWAQ
jgi:glutathione S-transferase